MTDQIGNTQGETENTMINQDQNTEKLLRIMTGYLQHASPFFPNTTKNPKIQNVLIQMLKDNKSGYTINFTRKALTFLSQHTSLEEPEARAHYNRPSYMTIPPC